MPKPRIVVFIPTLTSGGAEKQAVILANVLGKEYSSYLVVWKGTLVEPKFQSYIEENDIQRFFLKGNLLFRFVKLVKILKRNKINFIFNFLASNNFYGTIAGKIAGVKHIIGGIRNAEIPFTKLILQKYLHNYFLEFTIFNNYSGCKNLIERGFTSTKCVVIPNCFDKAIEPIIRLSEMPVIIVSLARFVPQKDFYTALKAFHHLVTSNKFDASLVKYRIIGYGEQEKQIYTWIEELGLTQFVEVIIKPVNALDLVRDSDIFLITSLFEGTSNSIMEAMSLSLPIVATCAGDNPYLIEENKNGFLSPIKDFKHLSSNLYKLVIDKDLRISFGKHSNFKLYKDYSISSFRESYFEFIDSQINGKNL